jgi:hypothetical protein
LTRATKCFLLWPKKRDLLGERKNRILGALERTGKATRQVICKKCGASGHRQGTWKCPLSGIKKRPRTTKVGRPKKVITEEEEPTQKKYKTGDDSEPMETAAADPMETTSPTTPTNTAAAPMVTARTPWTRSAARKEAAALQEEAAQQQAATPASSKRFVAYFHCTTICMKTIFIVPTSNN